MPKIINQEERKDPDLTLIYGALDAEDCIYLSLSFFRKEGSTMLPIVVQSLVAIIDEKYRLIDEKHALNLIQIKEKEKISPLFEFYCAKVQTNNRPNWSQYAIVHGVHLDMLNIFLSKARNDFLFNNPNNLTMQANLANLTSEYDLKNEGVVPTL